MSGDAVLSRFALISDNTHCPFAKKASLIGLNDLEGLPALYKALSRAAVPDEGIDGVVLELCDEGLKDAAEPELYCTMKRVLSELCQHNITVHPEDAKYCCYHILSAPNTQLRLCGQAFGAMCFAPSLSETDPR